MQLDFPATPKKDLTNVIFGIGSTKTSESTFRKGLLCCMTLPSAVVPQKKEMEPPNQNASQIVRTHINITILEGMPGNRRRHSKVNNIISAIDRLLPTLQLPAGTSDRQSH